MLPPVARLRATAALAAAIVLSLSCGSSTEPTPDNTTVAAIAVSPATLTLAAGDSAALTATVTAVSGAVITGRSVTWGVNDSSLATVTAAGMVHAKATGSVQVTATLDGKSGHATVSINPAPVASVVVAAIGGVTVRDTLHAHATTLAAGGDTLTGRAITWRSSDSTVVRISDAGAIVAVGAGSATITATSESREGSATVDVAQGALPVRGLYVQFERRGYPNGYYSGDAIKDFHQQDQLVPSLGLVSDELASQMDVIRGMGVNTITFELRSSDTTLVMGATYPNCNVSPSVGLTYPQPDSASLANLRDFLDLAQSKGLKVMLRLVNMHMDADARAGSQQWLGSILGAVKGHPALDLVLFEGDTWYVDSNGDGTADACGVQAEPPLSMGPDAVPAQYVQWAVGYAMSLGIPARQLSAEAVIGAYVVDMELGAGAGFDGGHQWHPLGVMKTIFDRLQVPDAERTYAVSFYPQRKCAASAGYPCTDESPDLWAEETLLRAWGKVGYGSRARMVAPEFGILPPVEAGWNTDTGLSLAVSMMRRFGVDGGSFWRWTNFTDAEDADANTPWPIKWRGTAYNYTPTADVLKQLYQAP